MPKTPAELKERRSQLRGLLLLAAIVFAFLLIRALHNHILPSHWWRP